MEINNLPVELTVVWNGHFNIDNPAQNTGAEGLGLVGK
jgi:plexin A